MSKNISVTTSTHKGSKVSKSSWVPIIHNLYFIAYRFHILENNHVDEKIQECVKQITISKHHLTGLRSALYEIYNVGKHIYIDLYILGITYKDSNKTSESGYADTQIGTTGSLHIGETHYDCMNRELAEEVGIVIKNTKNIKEISGKCNGKNKTFIVDCDGCEPYCKSKDDEKANEFNSNTKDPENKKVQVIVYGSKQKLTTLLKQIKQRYFIESDSKDHYNITALTIFNISEELCRYFY